MDAIASAAEEVLNTHPHPALRLGELLPLVAQRVDRNLRPERLRCAVEAEATRFRIIESWQSRWPTLARESYGTGDPWIVALAHQGSGAESPAAGTSPHRRDPRSADTGRRGDRGRHAARMLRETVRWIGRSVDGRSTLDVGRWYAIALAERATRDAIVRRGA